MHASILVDFGADFFWTFLIRPVFTDSATYNVLYVTKSVKTGLKTGLNYLHIQLHIFSEP